ncbi:MULTISPECIES: LytTR family DNA-binding domain-containing protein [unclassified Flavobacterium]|jgi:DNA-binding LytR/AlgR family response regulator|uniref:LytR/AlgR family response regulator transcription factor n=1 Tax=unclassified Flavobacterium TaxID=196869 RepID=UPI0006ABED8B|nr:MULTISPECIES: LytTR family DNA-binding domain-containing protein [unclassified Flavobacterium]KOP38425.1 LytTR family transcriptional regulator [Flavobacterium sp. VMW]KRB58010.1 LytTR family transcriptional regulator [Flavobacterium sp. Root186]OWU89965.1 LytTR family transcriptional regulator [Flavobacterium sp. NLM]PUU69397.1 DNA-binding response regulator [Flavobacterium sp. WLB]
MKIAIVEDEYLASTYLKSILEQQDILQIAEIAVLKSVKEAVDFFKQNNVDLAFMDIHLGDGKSLEIFEKATISCPVIFVTAYDSYAISVFKHFTIDYLLKPFEEQELLEALTKFKKIKDSFNADATLQSLVAIENPETNKIQRHFLVNHGYKLISVNESEITYFAASGKHLFIYVKSGNSYLYNSTITDIINSLDPFIFFKINRKYIVHRNIIKEVVKHSHQKIELILTVPPIENDPIIISKKEINNFKNWLDQ